MTGLIYVAIVALWAAVLIPMWLRRHDHDEAHRLQRHQEAMGILQRFGAGETAPLTPARRAARRRQLILASLVGLFVIGAASWWLGSTGVWSLVLPGLALGAFVLMAVATRRIAMGQVTAREAERSRQQHRAARAARREQRPPVETVRARQSAAVAPAASATPTPTERVRPWDELFDQTA